MGLPTIEYLKRYFDAFPQDREDLRRLVAEGRVEIVGGNYNEPNTNLISAEAIIRNAVYGIGFQRDVFGGDPRSAWISRRSRTTPATRTCGRGRLTSSAWARGPFHQWGPSGAEGGDRRMQFGTEFEWISPDGAGLLTAYWRILLAPARHHAPDFGLRHETYLVRGRRRTRSTGNVMPPFGSVTSSRPAG